MCCNLRIHVIVISIIHLIVTIAHLILTEIVSQMDGNNEMTLRTSKILVCLYLVSSGIMCLVGAIKNIKCLLIPFIIVVCLTILVCVILLIMKWNDHAMTGRGRTLWKNLVCLYSLVSGIMCLVGAINNIKCLLVPFMIGVCLILLVCLIWLIITIYCWVLGRSLEGATANVTMLFFLAFISIFLGPSVYILVIVAKFYKELASVILARQGDWVDVPERVALQSYVSPTVTTGSTVSVAPDTQINVSYESQKYHAQQLQLPKHSPLRKQQEYQPSDMKSPA